MTRILLVEDNPDMAFGLRNNLEIEGYDVEVAGDGRAGLERACAPPPPDLVILDVMLPEMNGYGVLRALRAAGSAVPVLMLTARGDEQDKVRGLRLGADDFVTKPFGVLELLARVEAVLRRYAATSVPALAPGAAVRFGDVEVDVAARTVLRDGIPVALAPRELDLLLALFHRGGRATTRQELMREVWGHRGAILSRTVDTHVSELRRKLERDPANPRHILTVPKSGYRLQR